jgi:hypothetical protein
MGKAKKALQEGGRMSRKGGETAGRWWRMSRRTKDKLTSVREILDSARESRIK